jgi:stage II sporulation protein P
MIAVGQAAKDTLEANGIKTVHLTEMFDQSSFNDAYSKSAEAVKKVMTQYPSIQYAIDLHRDSITDGNGNCISADFTFKEKAAAQIMFVVGTDEGGSGHTEWRKNLTTVLHLQERLYSMEPRSVRPINLRRASFYQDKSAGAMLVEIGTCGNTIEEAKRSAVIFADALAGYILGKKPSV